MLKKFIAVVFVVAVGIAPAWAQVDVNQADQAALDGIKGIGPAKSRGILEERKKAQFKDWDDLEKRVKGIGGKSAEKLSEAGLRVNGKPRGAAAGAVKADAAAGKVKN